MAWTIQRATDALAKYRSLLLPCAAAGLIFVILVPLPPAIMDLLLVANIALSILVLLTAIQVERPLDFSVFPTVLLGCTLLRLVLNVAITRLVLTAGADGNGAEAAQLAAGQVVWTFGHFVTSGSLAVGAILFAIIIIIQFIVVTKGAGRVSEVAARFVLDAMPGKQMAIDSELAAKLITESQARQRRAEIAREADFYGAMDGASKFLRGDAVAAIIITLVNLVGGMFVGMAQYGWSFQQTSELFSKLTIGDGLVTQIPAFIVAVAAGLIVTRSTHRNNLGEEFISQLVSRPAVLGTTAAFMGLLALTSLPTLPLLLLGGGCVGIAIILSRQQKSAPAVSSTPARPLPPSGGAREAIEALAALPQKADETATVDPLRIEIGYSLVKLTDALGQTGGDLLDRIASVRRQIETELGLTVPFVRIRDNMRLEAHSYVIKVRGVKVGEGRLLPGQLLAIADGAVSGKLTGRATNEPVFGSPAVWITPDEKPHAEEMNYMVVSPAAVLTTHLADVIRHRAPELLSRQQVAKLVEGLNSHCPALVKEVTERFKIGTVQKVLQSLLRERVPMHDLEAILEALSDWPGSVDDLGYICEHVRASLASTLSQQYCESDGKLWCVSLAPELEDEIVSHLENTARGQVLAMEGPLAARIGRSLSTALEELRSHGHRAVVLCSPTVRRAVSQLIAPARMEAAVLAYNEIESVEVKTLHFVGSDASC